LTSLLVPDSIAVLRGAAARETASASACALEAEARDALRALLEDPDKDPQFGGSEDGLDSDEGEEDLAWRDSLEQALSEDIHRALCDEGPSWLVLRANDLARTMAAAWIGFGRSGLARAAVLGGEGGEYRSLVDDLCRRFELSLPDARAYLLRVNHVLGEAKLAQTQLSAKLSA
jgi:hypothetical protein